MYKDLDLWLRDKINTFYELYNETMWDPVLTDVEREKIDRNRKKFEEDWSNINRFWMHIFMVPGLKKNLMEHLDIMQYYADYAKYKHKCNKDTVSDTSVYVIKAVFKDEENKANGGQKDEQ